MLRFITDNNILWENQSGFRADRSTTAAEWRRHSFALFELKWERFWYQMVQELSVRHISVCFWRLVWNLNFKHIVNRKVCKWNPLKRGVSSIPRSRTLHTVGQKKRYVCGLPGFESLTSVLKSCRVNQAVEGKK